MMGGKLVEKLDNKYCSSVIEGGLMESYDNVILFLNQKATEVMSRGKKFSVTVGKKSPMYKKEGLYDNVYHLNGCTIHIHRHFERGSGKMNIDVYGDDASRILDNLIKLTDVGI